MPISSQRSAGWAVVALAAVAVLLAASAGPVAGAPAGNATANGTVHHERPSLVAEEGDTESVQDWLSGVLGERLEGSAIQLSQGQYEAAEALVGEAFEDRVGQYVDVAGETDDETDDETGESYRTAREQQRTLVNRTRDFERTRREYERAREAGNESRARRTARRLTRLATDVNETVANATRVYATIAERTGTDLSTATQRLEQVRDEVSAETAVVRNETFTGTRLTVSANGTASSYFEPVAITGRLETREGSPIANRTIVLGVHDQRERVETNATGGFALTYRPLATSPVADGLAVRYRPAPTSPYFGASDRLDVRVRQVNGSLAVTELDGPLQFARPSNVTVSLAARGEGIGDVPVSLSLPEAGTATVRTGRTGAARTALTIGPDIPAGDATLVVNLPFRERAITASRVTAPVRVAPTATTLSLRADASGNATTVRGRLRAADRGVAGQTIAVSGNGTVLTRVQTNATGYYDATVTPPETTIEGTVPLTATFRGAGSNLESAQATAEVTIGAGSGTERTASRSSRLVWIAGGTVALLLAAGRFWYGRWTGSRTEPAAGGVPEDRVETGPGSSAGSTDSRSPLDAPRDLFEQAQYRSAVRAAYATLRDAVESDDTARTHWEFHDDLRDTGSLDAGDESRLQSVTETYERAAFAPVTTTRTDAEAALDAVEELLGTLARDEDDG